jgi:pyruvate dehydrogenase E2 component (dihydrolipoamide acetyltransferase)
MADFVMPILGSDMEAGTLVAWRKQPGDRLERGDIIAEVETEKGLIEVEVFTSGTLERLLVQPGAKVPVGTVLATIREDPGGAVAPRPAAPSAPVPPQPVVTPPTVFPPAAVPPAAWPRLRISPVARARATELGIDPAMLAGTGPDGAITLQDVERANPPVASADRHARMRQAIAAAMARSKREIPHFYLASTIDLEPALGWLEAENAQRPVTERLLAGVLFLKAVALALREVPELNARWEASHVAPNAAVHLGTATALRSGGLVAPALHDADRLGLAELMRAFRDVVQRARAGTLRSSELSDPTITVTSLGEQGAETVFPVIYPPQVAIVGFGRIVRRPWVVDDALVARRVVGVTLAADHRVTDGHRAGRFLGALERLLQEPARL